MKVTKEQLRQLIKEEIEEVSSNSALQDEILELIKQAGALDAMNALFFQELAKKVLREKRLGQNARRTPEERANIQAKAKATRQRNKDTEADREARLYADPDFRDVLARLGNY